MKNFVNITMALALALSGVWTGCSDDDAAPAVKVTEMKIGNLPDEGLTLVEGDTYALAVEVLPGDAADKDEYGFLFTSENEAVLTVDAAGTITAVAPGEAAVRVDAANNPDLWTIGIVRVEARIYPVTSITIPDAFRNHYMGVERTFDLGSKVTVNPQNATVSDVVYMSSDEMIASVNEYGEVYTHAAGDVKITVKATDGSGMTAVCDLHVRDVAYADLDRTGWLVSASHPFLPDAAVNGAPECLIDASTASCLVLVKPGKSTGGISVPAGEPVFFVIDMLEKRSFDFFRLRHRTSNTSTNLRVTKVSVYGSNDNREFVELVKSAPIAGNVNEVTVELPEKAAYRYFKMTYDGWNAGGNTMQISDFHIGNMTFE